jgi:hypothetical protein
VNHRRDTKLALFTDKVLKTNRPNLAFLTGPIGRE